MNRYEEYHPIANKLLNPDGTISTFDEVFGTTPVVPKSYFFAASDSTITISTDADNPNFLTGMAMIKTSNGFVLDPADGKIQNNTNREIALMQGTISFQPEKVDASTTLLYMWGERSLDGTKSIIHLEFAKTLIPNVETLEGYEVHCDGDLNTILATDEWTIQEDEEIEV